MVRGCFEDLLQELLISRAVSSFTVSRREVGEDGGYVRIKCIVLNGDILEFAEYIEVHENEIRSETYSFHWQSADGELIRR